MARRKKNLWPFSSRPSSRQMMPASARSFSSLPGARARRPAGTRRGATAAAEAASTVYKGYEIVTRGDGFVVPAIDRESHLDTLQDAKAFIADTIKHGRRNPKVKGAARGVLKMYDTASEQIWKVTGGIPRRIAGALAGEKNPVTFYYIGTQEFSSREAATRKAKEYANDEGTAIRVHVEQHLKDRGSRMVGFHHEIKHSDFEVAPSHRNPEAPRSWPTKDVYTVHETGDRLVISRGEWNSPRDGYRTRPDYWALIQDAANFPAAQGLRAGEYDVIKMQDVPLEHRRAADKAFSEADRLARPWAHREGGTNERPWGIANPAGHFLAFKKTLSETAPDLDETVRGPWRIATSGTPIEILKRGRGRRLLIQADYDGTPLYGWIDGEDSVTAKQFEAARGYAPQSSRNPDEAYRGYQSPSYAASYSDGPQYEARIKQAARQRGGYQSQWSPWLYFTDIATLNGHLRQLQEQADVQLVTFTWKVGRKEPGGWTHLSGDEGTVKPRAKSSRQRNPVEGADRMYEAFHGRPADSEIIVQEEIHEHENLATLGVLVSLKVKTLTGLDVTLGASDEDAGRQDYDETVARADTVYLASNEQGTQLYFEGGDQSLDLARLQMDGDDWKRDDMIIGVLYEVTYRTKKKFDKFRLTEYYHQLGEESGVQPMLRYDPLSPKLYVTGGQYRIEVPGGGAISPGIEN